MPAVVGYAFLSQQQVHGKHNPEAHQQFEPPVGVGRQNETIPDHCSRERDQERMTLQESKYHVSFTPADLTWRPHDEFACLLQCPQWVETRHKLKLRVRMTECELAALRSRIAAGERPTEELWVIRKSNHGQALGYAKAEALSDLWNLVFHYEGLFPKAEAAKALVEIALAADSSYPVSTNDGLIYDALTHAERLRLVQFIKEQGADANAPAAKLALDDFADDLLGYGPEV
jgi:hypothetical protein